MTDSEDYKTPGSFETGRWTVPLLVAILGLGALLGGLGMAWERQRNSQLSASNHALTTTVADMQSRMQVMTQQMTDMSRSLQATKLQPEEPAPQMVSQAVAAEPQAVKSRPKSSQKRAAKPAELKDPRFDQLQSKLNDQEQALASTRAEVANAQQELVKTQSQIDRAKQEIEGQLGNTRSELNGAIARTHDEVVALQKRGDRNYYEFDLNKSKQFSQVGPIGLSLKKVNTKQKNYEMEMMVDDQKLKKKSVNLYEPIFLSTPDSAQPTLLVVNAVSKDRVKGYISMPKYKRSELASDNKGEVKLQELQQR